MTPLFWGHKKTKLGTVIYPECDTAAARLQWQATRVLTDKEAEFIHSASKLKIPHKHRETVTHTHTETDTVKQSASRNSLPFSSDPYIKVRTLFCGRFKKDGAWWQEHVCKSFFFLSFPFRVSKIYRQSGAIRQPVMAFWPDGYTGKTKTSKLRCRMTVHSWKMDLKYCKKHKKSFCNWV